MPRNLDRRVEILFPIEDPGNIRYIRQVLDTYLRDNTSARIMQPDGSYKRLSPGKDEPEINSQLIFLRNART
jgi:polyphosphate kinase